MSFFTGLLTKMLASTLIKGLISAFKSNAFPAITISQEIIERKNDIAVLRLTFHPGSKTVDILRITAPGRKIQQAHVDQKLHDSVPAIIFLGFYDIYNPEKSGPFLESINQRIRILPEGIENKSKQLEIGISGVSQDETEAVIEIETEQNWFPQKFTILLDTEN